jgi:MerR family transcriptional regulator, copper efflux regulator
MTPRLHSGLAPQARPASGYRRYGNVEQRIAELERVRSGLAALMAACPAYGRAADCPILNALEGETSP